MRLDPQSLILEWPAAEVLLGGVLVGVCSDRMRVLKHIVEGKH